VVNVLLKKEPKAPFSSYGYLVYFVKIYIKVSKNYGTHQIFGSKKTLRSFHSLATPCRLSSFQSSGRLTKIKRKILAGFYPNFAYGKTSFNPNVSQNFLTAS
jgi:hypothetical protein